MAKINVKFLLSKNKINDNIKKVGKWMSLCCTVGYKWITVMDGGKFEFNDKISLYKKNDFEQK